MYKIIIAGTRDFNDYRLLEKEVHSFLSGRNVKDTEIVSGTARGADKLGEQLAKEYGLEVTKFVPDWDGKGKSAGFIRNWEMAKYADACIVFWDGKSVGTQHMIALAKKENLELKIVMYE